MMRILHREPIQRQRTSQSHYCFALLAMVITAQCCFADIAAPTTPPLIIVAEGRSGSSFLGSIFDNDPNFHYVYEPERKSTTEMVAALLRCRLDSSMATRLFWQCPLSTWCSESRLVVPVDPDNSSRGLTSNSSTELLRSACTEKPIAIKVVRRGHRYANLEELSELVNLNDARVIVLVRDPRAVVTSQIKHVKWHGSVKDSRKWADVAADVCTAHQQRMAMVRAHTGPTSVVHYEELVRSPMSTIASMYGDLGLGAIPRQVIEYVAQLTKKSNFQNYPISCHDHAHKISNFDAWSTSCYGVQHLLLARTALTRWKQIVSPRMIRLVEKAPACSSLFLSRPRLPLANFTSLALGQRKWQTFSKRFVRVFVSEHPAHFSLRNYHRTRRRRGRDLNTFHIYLVRQIDEVAYSHRDAIHEAVKLERDSHILENEVTILFKGDLIRALSNALAEMQERLGASPAHVLLTTDAIQEHWGLDLERHYLPPLCAPACTNSRGEESWINVLSRSMLEDNIFVGIGTSLIQSLLLGTVHKEGPAAYITRQKHSVLIMGDSLSRYVVEGYASLTGCAMRDWSSSKFKYKTGVSASLSCTNLEGGTLGFLHLYGNSAEGPYLHGHKDDDNDPWTSTPRRLCKGLQLWEMAHGSPPTEVVWSVMWWDENFIRKFQDAQYTLQNMARDFRKNLVLRLEDLDRCRAATTRIVLSTIPRTMVSKNRLHMLNKVVIDLGREMMIDVYDWDTMVWHGKAVDEVSESILFRDDTHPSVNVSEAFGRFLMQTRTQYVENSPEAHPQALANTELWMQAAQNVQTLRIERKSGLLRSRRDEAYLSHMLTIVVKTFNRPASLLRCLMAIRQLLGSSVTIIVVNDGDPGSNINLPPSLSVIEVDIAFDSGLSEGRNKGLDQAMTDYVLFLDDDVILETNAEALARLVHTMDREKAMVDIVGGSVTTDVKSYMRYSGTMNIVANTLYLTSATSSRQEELMIGTVKDSCVKTDIVPNVLLVRKRSLIDRSTIWDPMLKVAEHEDFFLRAKQNGLRVYDCGNILKVGHEQVRTKEYMKFRGREAIYGQMFLEKHQLTSLVDFHGNTKWKRNIVLTESEEKTYRIAFLVQTTPSKFSYRQVWRKWKSIFESHSVLVLFCIGEDTDIAVNRRVKDESAKHGDIVFLSLVEDYYNLSLKTLKSFEWAERNLGEEIEYIAKVDDDMYVNPSRLVDVLDKGTVSEQNGLWHRYPSSGLYMGHSNGPYIPYRPGDELSEIERKWIVTLDEYDARKFNFGKGQSNPNYPGPEYASGGLYIMSRDVVARLIREVEEREETDKGVMIKFEDVNVGLLLYSIGITLSKFQDCWRYPFQCSEDSTVAIHYGFSSRGVQGMNEMYSRDMDTRLHPNDVSYHLCQNAVGLEVGTQIRIVGPKKGVKPIWFNLDLQGTRETILMRVSIREEVGRVVRVAKGLSRSWMEEEISGGFPFFALTRAATSPLYLVTVHETHFEIAFGVEGSDDIWDPVKYRFDHRLPLSSFVQISAPLEYSFSYIYPHEKDQTFGIISEPQQVGVYGTGPSGLGAETKRNEMQSTKGSPSGPSADNLLLALEGGFEGLGSSAQVE